MRKQIKPIILILIIIIVLIFGSGVIPVDDEVFVRDPYPAPISEPYPEPEVVVPTKEPREKKEQSKPTKAIVMPTHAPTQPPPMPTETE